MSGGGGGGGRVVAGEGEGGFVSEAGDGYDGYGTWVEMTVGVCGFDGGGLRAMPPSVTVASGASRVLTLEEKFQGGTGVNLTPVPPWNFSSNESTEHARSATVADGGRHRKTPNAPDTPAVISI